MSAISFLVNLGQLDRFDSRAQIIDTLSEMNGTEFEDFLADLFFRMGYKVVSTHSTGDHGIDLFLKHDIETIAVQCKRWSKPVGEPVIRDFYGALLNSGEAKGAVITTTTFTAQAKLFAENKPIMLIDIDKLIELIRRYYNKNL